MEVFKKVKDYLLRNVGNMVTVGMPTFDMTKKQWNVPMLCKTRNGILIVGEFILDKSLDFVYIPTRE